MSWDDEDFDVSVIGKISELDHALDENRLSPTVNNTFFKCNITTFSIILT